jgi:hypothetical protein
MMHPIRALCLIIAFLCLSFITTSFADTSSDTPDISLQISSESWLPSGDLDRYWNPHKIGAAVEFTVEYVPHVDLVLALSGHEFEPSYIDPNLMVPELWMALMRGGVRGKLVRYAKVSGFVEVGALWVVTGFSSDEIAFPGHSARESEGGVYMGGGVEFTFLKSWSLHCSYRGHRVFSSPDEIKWSSIGIGIRKTWSGVSIFRGIWR